MGRGATEKNPKPTPNHEGDKNYMNDLGQRLCISEHILSSVCSVRRGKWGKQRLVTLLLEESQCICFFPPVLSWLWQGSWGIVVHRRITNLLQSKHISHELLWWFECKLGCLCALWNILPPVISALQCFFIQPLSQKCFQIKYWTWTNVRTNGTLLQAFRFKFNNNSPVNSKPLLLFLFVCRQNLLNT